MRSPRASLITASFISFLAFVLIVGLAMRVSAQPDEWPDRRHLPIEPYQKVGKITPLVGESDPIDWPKEIAAPDGATNVLLVMMDDVGFGASSTFGGPIQNEQIVGSKPLKRVDPALPITDGNTMPHE